MWILKKEGKILLSRCSPSEKCTQWMRVQCVCHYFNFLVRTLRLGRSLIGGAMIWWSSSEFVPCLFEGVSKGRVSSGTAMCSIGWRGGTRATHCANSHILGLERLPFFLWSSFFTIAGVSIFGLKKSWYKNIQWVVIMCRL